MGGSRRGHRSVPHTADVILEAWGADLASCCEEAAAALVETFVVAAAGEVVQRRHLHLAPASDEELLLDVLEEVIFVLDTADDVPVGVAARTGADGGLDVEVQLVDHAELEATGAAPKAVSRSGLQVDRAPGRVWCRFLVDL